MDGLNEMLIDPEGDMDWVIELLRETDARMEEDGVETMVMEQDEVDDPDIVMEDEKLIMLVDDTDPV